MSSVQDQVRWWRSLTRAEKIEFCKTPERELKVTFTVPESALDDLVERLERFVELTSDCEEDDGVST